MRGFGRRHFDFVLPILVFFCVSSRHGPTSAADFGRHVVHLGYEVELRSSIDDLINANDTSIPDLDVPNSDNSTKSGDFGSIQNSTDSALNFTRETTESSPPSGQNVSVADPLAFKNISQNTEIIRGVNSSSTPAESQQGGVNNSFSTKSNTVPHLVQDSRNFQHLEKNVKALLDNLSNSTVVDEVQREQLKNDFDRIFDNFRNVKLEELHRTGDYSRRLPFGVIHGTAHEIINSIANLTTSGSAELHRLVYDTFSKTFFDDSCYPQYSNHHTGCLERLGLAGCGKVSTGVKEDDKKLILALHNDHRSRMANGSATVGNITLPAAKSMRKMVWSDELAKLAQAWADQCNFTYDCADCRRTDSLRYVGQNMARFKGLKHFNYDPVWHPVVASWASKIKFLPVTAGNVSQFILKYSHDDSWAPYTQLIWDFTYLVGCGFSYYKDDASGGLFTQLYVCNYGPAGNILNTPAYEIGRGCTSCPEGHVCEKRTRLCTFKPVELSTEFNTTHAFLEHGLHGDSHRMGNVTNTGEIKKPTEVKLNATKDETV